MKNIKIGRMVLGAFQTNCYYVYQEGNANEQGRCPALIIDPAERGAGIFEAMEQKGFQIEGILLTHGHVDHIYGVAELAKLSSAKVYACDKEADVLKDTELNLSAQFGMPCKAKADEWLSDGQTIQLAGMHIQVLYTPGHTEGGCCYYFPEGGFVVSGDTLFDGSVGRTDFPTGSMSTLVRSIKKKLFELPDKTVVYPGHGGSTTIDWEKQNNPFVV